MYRFCEDAISPCFDTGTSAFNSRFQTVFLEGISTGDNKKVIIGLAVNGRFYPVDHFFLGNNFLVRAVAAALLGNLVLQVYRTGASLDHFLNGAGNVERPTPAGIDIHQQRRVHGTGDTTNVFQHIVHAGHAQIRHTVTGIGHTATGEVDGTVANLFRHHCCIGINGSHDLQGLLFRERFTEAAAGGQVC